MVSISKLNLVGISGAKNKKFPLFSVLLKKIVRKKILESKSNIVLNYNYIICVIPMYI